MRKVTEIQMNKCLILPVGLFFRCGNIFNYFIVLFNRNYKHQNLFPAIKHLLPRKWQQVLLFVKTRIFRRPWNISSFSSDHLEVVRESCSSYFHVEIFELVVFDCMFSYSRVFFICLVLVFFLNEHCIYCIMELSWKKSYSLATALGDRAWYNSQCAHS